MAEDQAVSPRQTFRDAARQVLEAAGIPLHYTEIAQRALASGLVVTRGRTPEQTMGAQLYGDVRRRGEQSPFVPVRRGVFGLRGRDGTAPTVGTPSQHAKVLPLIADPVERLCAEMDAGQYDSANPARLEKAVTRTFERLGFDAHHHGGSGEPDVLVIAHLGSDGYRAVIDAKSDRRGKVADADINWLALDSHRRQYEAQHAVVVGPSFAGGNLARYADQYQVALIAVSTLIELLRLHRETPFSLYELRTLLSTAGQSPYVLEQLQRQHQATRGHWQLLAEVVRLIDGFYRARPDALPIHPSNLHFMLAGQRGPADAPSVAELEDALKVLASRAVGVLRAIDGNGGYALAMAYSTALARLHALVRGVQPATATEGEQEPEALREPVGLEAAGVRRRRRSTALPAAAARPRSRQTSLAVREAVLSRSVFVLRTSGAAPLWRMYEELPRRCLARLRSHGLTVAPLTDVRGGWRVGRTVCVVYFSSPQTQPGNPHFYWFGPEKERLDQAAAHGRVFLVLALGSAEHVVVVPQTAIQDMLDTSPLNRQHRWNVQVLGRPGIDSLRLYMSRKQYRDATPWYNALGLIDGS